MLHSDEFPFLSVTSITMEEGLHRATSCAITGYLSSSYIPLFLIESSLTSHESLWIILPCLLISGPFVSQVPFLFQVWPNSQWNQDPSDLPRELLRSLTRSCFLQLLVGRFFLLTLLETHLPSRWSWLLTLNAPALDPFLSRQGATIALTIFHLTIWWSRLMALFLFLLAKAALTSLPTARFLVLRQFFPFRQAQYVHVFSLKPVPFCKLCAGLGSINKCAIALLRLSN